MVTSGHSQIRLLTKVSDKLVNGMKGKAPSDLEYDLLLEGASRVYTRRGDPLCFYLPGILADTPAPIRNVLSGIKETTTQRKTATQSPTILVGNVSHGDKVRSASVGYLDASPVRKGGSMNDRLSECRLTKWTGKHADQFAELFPLLQRIGGIFKDQVPDRYAAQMAYVKRTPPEFVIEGTPYTTLTVNNNFPTGVHKDAGDLDAGFSCLAVFRKGDYKGGRLVFPQWRVAVDLQDGDLILMDAHQWHGNTIMTNLSEDAERVAVVLYYRTYMAQCPVTGEPL